MRHRLIKELPGAKVGDEFWIDEDGTAQTNGLYSSTAIQAYYDYRDDPKWFKDISDEVILYWAT